MQTLAHPTIKLMQLLLIEGVIQGQHWHRVLHLFKAIQGDPTHTLAG